MALIEETSRHYRISRWAVIASPHFLFIMHACCINRAFLLHCKADNANDALIPHFIRLTKQWNAGSGTISAHSSFLKRHRRRQYGKRIIVSFTPMSHLRVWHSTPKQGTVCCSGDNKKKLQTCNQRLQFQSFKIPFIVTIKTARYKVYMCICMHT